MEIYFLTIKYLEMKFEIKSYKRWPKREEVLLQRLKKINNQIDRFLSDKTPVEFLRTLNGKTFYKEEYTKLFDQTKYPFGKPKIYFKTRSGHVNGINIIIYIKNRSGKLILI